MHLSVHVHQTRVEYTRLTNTATFLVLPYIKILNVSFDLILPACLKIDGKTVDQTSLPRLLYREMQSMPSWKPSKAVIGIYLFSWLLLSCTGWNLSTIAINLIQRKCAIQ